MADDTFLQRVRRRIHENRQVLNRLEAHLGCVVCRGPLTDGVCPACDPADARDLPFLYGGSPDGPVVVSPAATGPSPKDAA